MPLVAVRWQWGQRIGSVLGGGLVGGVGELGVVMGGGAGYSRDGHDRLIPTLLSLRV
jgi:hypothetical protein